MNINKLIFKYFVEITLLVLVIFITYPVWQVLGESKGASIAESFKNFESDYITTYVDKVANLNDLYPINDKDVDKSNYTSVNVVNNSNEDKKFGLVIAVDKNSTINADSLKISINDIIYNLDDLYLSNNEYSQFYIIDEGIIEPKSVINNKILIWLSSETGNDMQNKSLSFNFQLLNR